MKKKPSPASMFTHCIMLSLVLLFPLTSAASSDQTTVQKWYDKSFEEILNSRVVTATRTESTLKNVPGVVTVFSGEEITTMGLRSLKEVLERTTGFFVNRQFTGATVGSRGFIADTDQFLLLIDGHNMNSIIDKGMGEQFLFPNLEHVARVEIIRGPGSTLWGSDAALGIIHVITKDGGDIDGLKATINRSNEDNQQHINIQAGTELTDDIHAMASLTLASSDGFSIVTQGGTEQKTWGPWDALEDSYELYTKVRLNEFTIKARAYDSKTSRPYNIFQAENEPGFTRRSHYYLDLTHEKAVSAKVNFETRFFTDLLKRTQILVAPKYSPEAVTAQESEASQESSMGLEFIARIRLTDYNQLMLGYRGVETELDPYTHRLKYPVNATVASPLGEISQLVVPTKNDVNQAIFIEDNWELIPNTLTVLLGVRFDNNNLREDKLITLPRFSLNWQANQFLQLKSSYNTGYIRPSVGVGFLGQAQYNPQVNALPIIGAGDSQEIRSFDQQFIITTHKLRMALNLYTNHIKNPFQVIFDNANVDGEDVTVFYTNVNEIKTYGAEIEVKYLILDSLDIYTNVSHVISAKTESLQGKSNGYTFDLNQSGFFGPSFGQGTYNPDGTMQGFPHLIVNFGINWNIIDSLSSNLHFRYWDQMETRDYSNSHINFQTDTVELDAQLFVDLNVHYENIVNSGIDASFFVKNVLDNDDAETYMVLYSNTWQEQGRRIGASLSYKF